VNREMLGSKRIREIEENTRGRLAHASYAVLESGSGTAASAGASVPSNGACG
jgi:hypothetical protein